MKRFNLKYAGLALLASASLASCSTDFLEEKINYDYADPSIYNYYDGCAARVSDCYRYNLPDPNGNPGWQYTSTGKADDWSKCTEEFAGFGIFVDPKGELNTVTGVKQVPDYFQGQDAANIQNNVWGFIRNINDAIIGIEGGTLTREEKDELVGQLYFLRAWRYFNLVKWYGGVPIITDLPEIAAGSVTPRSSLKECVDFIIDDLDKAAAMLEAASGAGQWLSGSNYGRATVGSALALKGRVLTWWCSPIFNRTGDQTRYTEAYAAMKADLEKINAAGYALMRPDGEGNTIRDWSDMFQAIGGNTEGVFIARFNNIPSGGRPDYSRNNPWEHLVRPSNTMGGGGIEPSAMLVDLFPMKDGRVPNNNHYTKLPKSGINYDANHPFIDRDNRFYRTFGFPGLQWQFNGTVVEAAEGDTRYPFGTGSNYELWNYVWYIDADKVGDENATGTYGADGLASNAKGMYVTKRSTGDSGMLAVAFNTNQGFRLSYASYLELRYAEVLLNLAEVACGAGDMEYAAEQLKAIRQRAGYKEAAEAYQGGVGNFGLPEDVATDAAVCMASILYERQVEFAYEGKRFDDMRRWLLFDGGADFDKISGAPASWKLTGWGGNTCEWLGYTPLNGQRREKLEFQVKPTISDGLGGNKWNNMTDAMPDPIAQKLVADGVISTDGKTMWEAYKSWRSGNLVKLNSIKRSNNKLDPALAKLRDNFYEPYLQRKLKRGDASNNDQTIDGMVVTFLPRYYLLGLNNNAQTKNPTLEQTIGWEDYNNGGQGTFDPLAE